MSGARAGTHCPSPRPCYPDTVDDTQTYSYFFKHVEKWGPFDEKHVHIPPKPNEMRITFLGSVIPPVRRAQQEMSIFVEVGNALGEADQFVFDCGSGVSANYGAMGISYGVMNKVFLTHLHGDHMSDLTHFYCFGAAANRKSPLYVWGPSRSGVRNPKAPPEYYEDGVIDMCKAYRKAWRWHSESFSFLPTDDRDYRPPSRRDWGLPHDPVPVEDDSPRSGYALVPIELDWQKYGKREGDNVAYYNEKSGVKITHFPVIHCRQGSIGYKLEWNGLSMIYTSDTKPEVHSITQARNKGNGVDVFIHECVVPPDVWAFKNLGLKAPPDPDSKLWDAYQSAVKTLTTVQDSSHTPQGAFGYLLSKIDPPPRLTVATHFPVADDTVACAFNSIRLHCPWVVMDPYHPNNSNLIWSFDLMVLSVFPRNIQPKIQQFRAEVSDYGFSPVAATPQNLKPAKYHHHDGSDDPYKQLDLDTWIEPTNRITGACNYRKDGY
jgi:ribonuclease Z